MRFSVPSICACRSRKFSFDLRSGYASVTANRLFSALRELTLRRLEFRERRRIVQQLGRGLDGADLGARLGHADEHLLLLDGEALHRVHEVRDEIRAALVLVHHLGPGGLHAFVLLLQRVVAAPGEASDRQPAEAPESTYASRSPSWQWPRTDSESSRRYMGQARGSGSSVCPQRLSGTPQGAK